MKIKVTSLTEGFRLSNDVEGKTKEPIVPRNTVITKEIIEVLRAFLIDEVEVERVEDVKTAKREGREKRTEETQRDEQLVAMIQTDEFVTNYLQVVEQFKIEFKKWQSGKDVDVFTIRNSLIPLFEDIIEHPHHLLFIHKYGNKKDYLFHHAVATALISGMIARKLNLPKSDTNQVVLATVLSNSGMAKLEPYIVTKTSFTEAEQSEIRKHPVLSFKMVQHIPSLNHGAKLATLQHEEREDGSGFPFGEKGDRIHSYAKIIACSDEYYKIVYSPEDFGKTTPFAAIEKMEINCFGKIDIGVLEALKACMAQYAVAVDVQLSNEKAGTIVFVDPNNLAQPVVRLKENGQIISLAERTDLTIDDIG